jgi:hypothetical protein
MTNDIEEETKAVAEDKGKAIPEEKSAATTEDKLPKAGELQDDELESTTGGVRTYGPIMN